MVSTLYRAIYDLGRSVRNRKMRLRQYQYELMRILIKQHPDKSDAEIAAMVKEHTGRLSAMELSKNMDYRKPPRHPTR
jgi:hypothetical protein